MAKNYAVIMNGIRVVKDLLESSSSTPSSDEELVNALKREPRHRVKNFIRDVVEQYTTKEFKDNFRMSRNTADFLINNFKESLHFQKRNYQGGRSQTTAELQVLSFLWFCSNKNSIREVSNIFGISQSTFHLVLNKVMIFLVEDVAPRSLLSQKMITLKKIIAMEFEKISGFPNVLGCIDGSYISIRNPKHKIKSTYVNRHDMTSITLQGIRDSKLRFLDVYTGVPSKIHNSRIFKMSFISKDLASICGSQYHLLGDAAYPIREYLLTPYRDYGKLQNCEKEYNLRFCQTRVKIENAFGALKSRFRQIMRLDFHEITTMAKFVLACCTLHNICIDKGDKWEIDDANSVDERQAVDMVCNIDDRTEETLKKLGEAKRTYIKTFFTTKN